MNINYLNNILTLGMLFLSTQLLSQTNINETDLSAEIASHQSTAIAKPFSFQQAVTKSKIRLVQLSPDGKHLFYITKETNGVALHLLDIKTDISKTLFHSTVLKRADWSTDGKILFLQGESYLAYIDPFAQNAKAQIFYRFNDKNEETFYGIDSSQEQQLLVSRKIITKNDSKPHQLVRINKEGGETILYADKIKIYDHLFDDSGKLSFIRQPDKQRHNIYLLNGKKKIFVFSCMVIDQCRMIKFNNATQELFILGFNDFNFRSLYSLNIQTKTIKLIHQDPMQIADLLSVNIDATTGEVIQLDYLSDRMRHYGLSDELDTQYQWLESQLVGNLYISSRKNGDNWLLKHTNAQLHHHKYYIYNIKTRKLKPILQQSRLAGQPISSEQLVTNIPISYSTSDGMAQHGYVMLPTGRNLSEVPLLTSIHGGPFSRVRGGYSPIQYLVNQGYAVFQPNFRSSTGYGLQYMLAGKEKFSTRVQQDIIDGINYLLNQGIGNKQKMGIFGHSFGGYSVLSLMASHPDMFVAGVATAPGTDLLDLLKTMDHKGINEYEGVPLKAALPILFADMQSQSVLNKIKSTSPRASWKGIKKPLLMWGGAKDERIPITHLRDFALKLKQAGQPIEFIEDKNTGHNPAKSDTITPKVMLYLISEYFNRYMKQTDTDSDIDLYLKRFRVY